jgi:hypothetical protein
MQTFGAAAFVNDAGRFLVCFPAFAFPMQTPVWKLCFAQVAGSIELSFLRRRYLFRYYHHYHHLSISHVPPRFIRLRRPQHPVGCSAQQLRWNCRRRRRHACSHQPPDDGCVHSQRCVSDVRAGGRYRDVRREGPVNVPAECLLNTRSRHIENNPLCYGMDRFAAGISISCPCTFSPSNITNNTSERLQAYRTRQYWSSPPPFPSTLPTTR